jgi:predicted nucleic acid-binding protein
VIVIDASVAVRWVVDEAHRAEAMQVFDLGHELSAPDLIFPEVANVLRKKVKMNQISAEQARLAMLGLVETPMAVVQTAGLAGEALSLAQRLDHPAYDCFYLACALGAGRLVTADEQFATKCAAAGFASAVVALKHISSLESQQSG